MLEVNSLQKCLHDLDDPRSITHSSRHLLSDILLLTILAVLCGADNWVGVEKFGKSKYKLLKDILVLPNGIPSHDTIGDLFLRLNPEQLQSCFLKWVNAVFDFSGGEIIAIDGKTLRHSYDTASDKPAIHMVSAWACKNNLVLGQLKTEEKSNEITAIPELLKSLNLKDNIVTIDAMGCQKKIAKQIIDQEGDYVLNLKANQPKLNKNVSSFLNNNFDDLNNENDLFDKHEVTNNNHGRIESRRYFVTDNLDWLPQSKDWSGLKSVGMVEYERIDKTTGEIVIERRFFISSLSANARIFANAIRMHWGIENGLHWCLDVGFNEDNCRVRKDYSSENFAVIRHIALNLLKQEKTAKVGIKIKRQMAGWDNNYLAKILDGSKQNV